MKFKMKIRRILSIGNFGFVTKEKVRNRSLRKKSNDTKQKLRNRNLDTKRNEWLDIFFIFILNFNKHFEHT